MNTSFFYSILLLLITCQVSAQDTLNQVNTDLLTGAKQFSKNNYFQKLVRQVAIYDGSEYVEFDFRVDGHQFLNSKLWEYADILFENLWYENVAVRYDIYRDLLVVKHFDQNGKMVSTIPDQEAITAFKFYDRDFIRPDKLYQIDLNEFSDGFYQVLFRGENDLLVLAKRRKLMMGNIANKVQKEMIQKDRFYLAKNQKLYSLNRRKDIWNLFPEYKKKFKRFARRNQLYFSSDKSSYILEIMRYFESINKAR